MSPISFVQEAANSASNAQTFSVPFKSKTTAGDLILVGIDFESNATPSAVTDSQGNTYTQIGTQLASPGGTYSRVYYANNVQGGSDTVTIQFSANSSFLDVYLTEYSGVDPTNPIDAQAGTSGASGEASSGTATTTATGDVIYVYCVGDWACTAGSGFTARSTLDENLIEDMPVGNPGPYAAAAIATNGWTMQMVALKPAPVTGNRTKNGRTVQGPVKKSVASGVSAEAAVLPALSALSCSPRAIDAGGQATCELRVAANSTPAPIQLTSSSPQVTVPATVVTRANQTRLTFQVSADAAARQQLVTVTALAGSATVQDTIQVAAGSQPIVIAPHSQAGKRGSPLRFTVSAADPAELPVQLAASDLPAGATFDAATGGFEWTPAATQGGKHKVTFTATNAAGRSSSAQVTMEVTSGDPTLGPAERACSPGAVATLTGSWLAEPGPAVTDPSGNAMELGGTKVKVNGEYVPVLSASSTEVDFVCPSLSPETQLAVAVETASEVSGPVSMAMQSASPWIFGSGATGQTQGVVSFIGTTEMAMARNSQVAGHPAQPGDEILLWGTGLGASSEALSGTVSVKLGGVDAEVEAVNAVPGHAGVYTIQVRVPVPMDFGDGVPVEVQVKGADGKPYRSNSVTIAIEPVLQ
jgi:uncharacterized protein (TIGR03437 family)